MRVVLVEPLYSGNVGAVCRSCANFGVSELVLVRPKCALGNDEIKMAACGESRHVLENLRVVHHLDDALSGISRSIAMTRRSGRLRQHSWKLGLHEVFSESAHNSQNLALVFGREDSGLNSSDIDLCSELCVLPTSEMMPSMNLSHAVAVVLYEWTRSRLTGHQEKGRDGCELAEFSHLDPFRRRLGRVLQMSIDHNGRGGVHSSDRLVRILWQSLKRARLTETEVQAWQGYLSHLEGGLSASPSSQRQNVASHSAEPQH